jgi:hypothetical protein
LERARLLAADRAQAYRYAVGSAAVDRCCQKLRMAVCMASSASARE